MNIWMIIESYFKDKHLENLVRHQLESYNNFVNYQIIKTIEMFNPVYIVSENDYDEKTKLRISYQYLTSASKAFEATPCIKRYLFSQIESRFLEITADEWDIAALLPMESFVGATANKVHSESRNKF
jgi:DNA-directed RNA polymerase beta subunit